MSMWGKTRAKDIMVAIQQAMQQHSNFDTPPRPTSSCPVLAGAAVIVSPLTAPVAGGLGKGNRWALSRVGGYTPFLQRFLFIYS